MPNVRTKKMKNININPEICKKCKNKWCVVECQDKTYLMYCINDKTQNSFGDYESITFASEISKENANIIMKSNMSSFETLYGITGTKKIFHPIIISNELKKACELFTINKHDECPYYFEHQLSNWNEK